MQLELLLVGAWRIFKELPVAIGKLYLRPSHDCDCAEHRHTRRRHRCRQRFRRFQTCGEQFKPAR